MKLKIIFRLICLTLALSVNGQKETNETIKIDPFSYNYPLYELKKENLWSDKFMDSDGNIIKEVSKVFKQNLPFRVKCYQIANKLPDTSNVIKELKSNMDSLLFKYRKRRELDYSIEKEKLDELDKEILQLEKKIDTCKCPKINQYRGSLTYKNGYLIYDPMRIRIKTKGEKNKAYLMGKFYKENEALRVISYLNDSEREKLGIKLREGELYRTKRAGTHYSAITLPVRIYLTNNADDEDKETLSNVDTGLGIGVYWGFYSGYYEYDSKGKIKTKTRFSWGPTVGFSKLTLKSSNTNGPALAQDRDVLNLSIGAAISWNVDDIAILLVSGYDTAMSDRGKDWIYQFQPWIGFGVGLNIFK